MSTYQPKISVIIATLNRELVLENTLRYFFFNEDYPNFELVVVDQSDSHEPQLASFLHQNRNRMRYIHPDYKSLPRARNDGLRNSNGEIVVFVDDDVVIPKGFLNAHAQAYLDPKVMSVAGAVTPPEGRLLSIEELTESERGLFALHMRFDVNFPFPAKWAAGCNMSFRRCIFERVGGFDEHFLGAEAGDDSEMSHRILKSGGLIQFQPQAHLVHLSEPGGGCRNWRGTGMGLERSAFSYNYFRHKIGMNFLKRYIATGAHCLRLILRNNPSLLLYIIRGFIKSEILILTKKPAFFDVTSRY